MYNPKEDYEENQAKQFTEDELRRQRYAAVALNRIALTWEREYAALTAPVIVEVVLS